MFPQVLTLLFHEFAPHSVQMIQFQLYFHLLMYHIHHVFNHLYHALLCCTHIYYEFAVFLMFVNFLDVEYHQHQCLIQNFVLTCLKM